MLPERFVFSQSSLQDYEDCKRRFQLRYLEHCRWPSPESADALEMERRMQQGLAFHRLMSRLHSGVPADALQPTVSHDPDLARWWANYGLASPPDLPAGVRESEWTLSVPLGDQRLTARYDLVAGEPGQRWVIVDWKTGQRRSTRSTLRDRLQTHIYPWAFVQGGAVLNGGLAVVPEQVEMLYWFSEFPAQTERFPYDVRQVAADTAHLEALVQGIAACPADGFVKTEDKRRCRFCVYRSLCWQDVQAGLFAEWEAEEWSAVGLEVDLDLDAIAPVPF